MLDLKPFKKKTYYIKRLILNKKVFSYKNISSYTFIFFCILIEVILIFNVITTWSLFFFTLKVIYILCFIIFLWLSMIGFFCIVNILISNPYYLSTLKKKSTLYTILTVLINSYILRLVLKFYDILIFPFIFSIWGIMFVGYIVIIKKISYIFFKLLFKEIETNNLNSIWINLKIEILKKGFWGNILYCIGLALIFRIITSYLFELEIVQEFFFWGLLMSGGFSIVIITRNDIRYLISGKFQFNGYKYISEIRANIKNIFSNYKNNNINNIFNNKQMLPLYGEFKSSWFIDIKEFIMDIINSPHYMLPGSSSVDRLQNARRLRSIRNGIHRGGGVIREPIVTSIGFNFGIFPRENFNMFNEVSSNSFGYHGRLAPGEPNIPLPDAEEKFSLYILFKRTREYMEHLDPNRNINVSNALHTISLDTIESQFSAKIAQKVRKIVFNHPEFSGYINGNQTINWEGIRISENSMFMRYLKTGDTSTRIRNI